MGRRAAVGRGVAVLAVAVGVVACSGDDDAGAPTTLSSSPSTVVGPTEPAAASVPTTAVSTAATTFEPASSLAPTATPAFVTQPCELSPPAGSQATCGYVEVPERHSDRASRRVRVAVAVVTPEGAATTVPVVSLAGGPGYGSLGDLDQPLADRFGPRPVVLVDYRGVGSSVPSLACPEVDELALPALGVDPADPAWITRHDGAVQTCHDRLAADGVDLAAYNYSEIAADLADIRVALGVDQWDLYGISNGGRVALEAVRRRPEGIRSLVLDAALPPQGNLPGELWPHAQRAFDVLFAGCAADPACSTAFPDLGATFDRLVADLGSNPVEVSVPAPDGNGTVVVRFGAAGLPSALRGALYDSALIPYLPLFLSGFAAGEGFEQAAALIADGSIPRRFSQGMELSVDCQEEIAFLPAGFFAAQAAEYPQLAPAILADRSVETCALWDVGRADASIEAPVTSDLPALLLVGEYDPVHPRGSSEQIASGLSHATLVELPGLGHGTLGVQPCPTSLVVAFLADPAAPVDTGCAAAMPPPAWAFG